MKRRQKRMSLKLHDQGFTMVELLVAMAVSLLALAAIYSTFLAQHRSYQVQEETSEMQQNIRTAMYYMQRDIRMAGNDPFDTNNFGFVSGVSTANANVIQFTSDISGALLNNAPNGTYEAGNEQIQYYLADPDGDGVNDLYNQNGQVVAQNIDAIDFVYLDANGVTLNSGGAGVPLPNYSQIRSVEITIVARTTDRLLYGSTNNITYRNQQNETILLPQGDNVSRRRLTALIHCRNLSL